jgi:tRNA U34 5-methylaminomethyl-2-thiouridine-forming methyltransferase MnmC
MRPRAILSTFTSAFRVRRALSEAGLAVGRGPAVGRKRTGTLASHAADQPPLRPAVAARLARGARFAPEGSAPTPPLA